MYYGWPPGCRQCLKGPKIILSFLDIPMFELQGHFDQTHKVYIGSNVANLKLQNEAVSFI